MSSENSENSFLLLIELSKAVEASVLKLCEMF